MAKQLEAVQAARISKVEETTALEVETSSSSSSDSEKESLIQEGLNDIRSTWKKLRGKDLKDRSSQPKTKISFKLASLLVYTVGVKCHGLDSSVEYAPEHIFSLSENAANRIVKANMHDLVKHTQTHLVRVYPKGTRVDSSNYQPHRYWAAGCQVVAINCQTFGKLTSLILDYRLTVSLRSRKHDKSGHVSTKWLCRLRPEARCPSPSRQLGPNSQKDTAFLRHHGQQVLLPTWQIYHHYCI